MKKNEGGFILAETLVVTTFIAGVLVYLFIQFSNLNQKYNESFIYNTVEDLYALEDVKDFIESDSIALNNIETSISNLHFIDITNCEIFTNTKYCSNLFSMLNINEILITKNKVNINTIKNYSKNFNDFIKKIEVQGKEKYRIIASFKNNTFATVRFGE